MTKQTFAALLLTIGLLFVTVLLLASFRDMRDMKRNVSTLASEVAGLKNDGEGLSTLVNNLAGGVADLTSSMTGLKSELDRVKKDIGGKGEFENRFGENDLKSDVDSLKGGMAGLKRDAVSMQADIEMLQKNDRIIKGSLDGTIDKLNSLIALVNDHSEELTRHLNEINKQAAWLNENADVLRKLDRHVR